MNARFVWGAEVCLREESATTAKDSKRSIAKSVADSERLTAIAMDRMARRIDADLMRDMIVGHPVCTKLPTPRMQYWATCPKHQCPVMISHDFSILQASCDHGCHHKGGMGTPLSANIVGALEREDDLHISSLLAEAFRIPASVFLGEKPGSLEDYYTINKEKEMYEDIERVFTFLVVNLNTHEVTQVFAVANNEPDARFKALRSVGVDIDNMDEYYIARRDQFELPRNLTLE